MSLATRAGGGIALLVVAGLVVSWFGNPANEAARPDPSRTPKATPSQPRERHVKIAFFHRQAKSDMRVAWNFGEGHKRGSDTIAKEAISFDIDDVVPVGVEVSGSAQVADGVWDPPEAIKVQIYFDNQIQCPDHFFGRGMYVACKKIVK